MDIPNEYKTDHLFLLVGTNPLPNLVAAKLLLKEGGTLHLVHSPETIKVADRLREHLQVKTYLLPVDPTDAQDIERQIKHRMREVKGTVGLHYTGGTKAMAVHAYRAVERVNKLPKPVFSYLDAETFELRIDPSWHEAVLLTVKPNLEDLANLHGVRLRENSPQRDSNLFRTAMALASCVSKGGLDVWRAWCHTSNKHLQSTPLTIQLPSDPSLEEVATTLRQDLGLETGGVELPANVFSSLIKWFNGGWLEHYVFAKIIEVAKQSEIHDYGMNLATEQGRSSRSDFDFEFDVAAMRGYQLFGISCTTSVRKSLAKTDLFEAYIRARQLGGDEARVGLVCLHEGVRRFEREVMQEWQVKDKIKVFGLYELPDLSRYLVDWFMTAH